MRGLFNILIGLVFIGGGLSGRMALIFTDSPMALAAVGVVLVGMGVMQMLSSSGDAEA